MSYCRKNTYTGPWGAPTTHTLRLWGQGGGTGPGRQQGAPRAGTLQPRSPGEPGTWAGDPYRFPYFTPNFGR